MNVMRLPGPPAERGDPLAGARVLLAEYEALPARERNYRSSMYAGLFSRALADLVSSCTPLRAAVAEQMVELLRRAEDGDTGAAVLAAVAAAERRRHLKAVE